MNGFILITCFFLIGILLRRSGRIPEGFSQSLITFIVNVSLPALTLNVIHGLTLNSSLVFPILVPWIVFVLAGFMVFLLTRFVTLSRETVGCLIVLCGISNTSIIGIPLIDVFFGHAGYGAALIVDQSNFFVMCIPGIITASVCGAANSSPSVIAKRILAYPSIYAIILAFLLKPFIFPSWLQELLQILGRTLTPLALIALGAMFRFEFKKHVLGPFFFGMVVKLIVIPLCVLTLFYKLVPMDQLNSQVAIIQSGMPPMILAGLIAADSKLNPPLALNLVAFGIPLSFVSLMGLNQLLRFFV